ncbi:MAG: alpha/beta hydrolase [Anaerolineae bacterium]|nr:alpha/beta hydrolase [Anaerolineae bacterium]
MKWLKRIGLGLLGLLLVSAIGFYAWTQFSRYPAKAQAKQIAQQSTPNPNGWLVFQPAQPSTQGFVIYPGGLVDAQAYAPVAKALAERGIFTVIVPVPLELAITNIDAAKPVIDAYPNIRTWAVGGHSLGGASACMFVARQGNNQKLNALVLWGAYCTDNVAATMPNVISIYGAQDNLVNKNSAEKLQFGLPANTRWVVIGGGNHAMFGDYGEQSGDGPLTLAPDEARRRIVDETASFILGLK